MNPLIRSLLVSLLVALLIPASSVWAESVVLYDPDLGTLPDQQGWAYVTKPILIAKAKRSLADGVVRLDTTPAMDEWVGFLTRVQVRGVELRHPRMPDLDRKNGYTIRFHARLVEEQHAGNDRAGFSVVVVGNDLRAIELAFWSGEIWAQSGPRPENPNEPLFTHTVERAEVDTSRAVAYELRVLGDAYSLWAGDQRLLAGPLRDYSSHWHPAYSQANTIFLGDNTSRAAAVVELGRVEAYLHRAENSP